MKTHEMNILGVSVLQDIRKVKGFEEAVIAGGFIRDDILKGQFTDIDIFVPYTNEKTFHTNFANLKNSPFTTPQFKPFSSYGGSSINVKKYDCQYMGIEVDLMAKEYHPEKSEYKTFGEFIVHTFSYGIDMVWYDGEVKTTKEFDYDLKNQYATLLELPSIEMLPGALRKYERFIAKYPQHNFRFKSSILTLDKTKIKEEVKSAQTIDDIYKQLYGMASNHIERQQAQAQIRPVDWRLNPAQLNDELRAQVAQGPMEGDVRRNGWENIDEIFENGRWIAL